MSDRWLDYFGEQKADNPAWLAAAVQHWAFMQNMYGELQHLAAPGARVLDVGCGMGFTDLYLASLGYKVTGIDNDDRIVNRARDFSRTLGIDSEFRVGDAFDLKGEPDHYEVAFSLGVLEHFDRAVTVQLLKEQARCARHVMICIPTPYTAYAAPITDERFYSVRELEAMVRDAGLDVIRSFGFGDVTATRSQRMMRLLMPRALYRLLQNRGLGFNICVVGRRRGG